MNPIGHESTIRGRLEVLDVNEEDGTYRCRWTVPSATSFSPQIGKTYDVRTVHAATATSPPHHQHRRQRTWQPMDATAGLTEMMNRVVWMVTNEKTMAAAEAAAAAEQGNATATTATTPKISLFAPNKSRLKRSSKSIRSTTTTITPTVTTNPKRRRRPQRRRRRMAVGTI